MNVNFTSLKAYTAAIDTRIASKTDNEILGIINEGISLLANQTQCFSNAEDIGLDPYLDANILKFTIVPVVDEVIDYYDIQVSVLEDLGYVPAFGGRAVYYEKQNDKSIIVTITNADAARSQYLSIKYFYVPSLALTGDLVIESEVFNILKTAINVIVWGLLKDYEKEQKHMDTLMFKKSKKTITVPSDFNSNMDISQSFIRGGFV